MSILDLVPLLYCYVALDYFTSRVDLVQPMQSMYSGQDSNWYVTTTYRFQLLLLPYLDF